MRYTRGMRILFLSDLADRRRRPRLERLANSAFEARRTEAANSAHLPEDLAIRLSTDSDQSVREAINSNPRVSDRVKAMAALAEEPVVLSLDEINSLQLWELGEEIKELQKNLIGKKFFVDRAGK